MRIAPVSSSTSTGSMRYRSYSSLLTRPPKSSWTRASRLGAGLLVMGAYGQPSLREFIVGSVTRTILRESPVPVFLFY